MKNTLLLSTVLVTILGSTTLFATSSYHDSLNSKEQKAISNPSSVSSQASAKAKVEEIGIKEKFIDKMDREKFAKDSQTDKDTKH